MINLSVVSIDDKVLNDFTELDSSQTFFKNIYCGNNLIKLFSNDIIQNSEIIVFDYTCLNESNAKLLKLLCNGNYTSKILILLNGDEHTNWSIIMSHKIHGIAPIDVTKSELKEVLLTMYATESYIHPKSAHAILKHYSRNVKKESTIKLKSLPNQVLMLLAQGKSYIEISESLNISINGVRYYIKSLYKSIGVNSKSQAVAYYMKHKENF